MRRFFKRLFKRNPPPPTLRQAFFRARTLCEEFNELCFYTSQISNVDLHKDILRYMEKADYNLTSFRDEVQILLNKEIEYEAIRKRLKRSRQSD